MFIDRLIEKIKEKNNPTVVGLDSMVEFIPDFITQESFNEYGKTLEGCSRAVLAFNKEIIDKIFDIVPAVKFQMACYEILGTHGIDVLLKSMEYARQRDLSIILDAKRNDIGLTAKAYSAAYLGRVSLDSDTEEAVFDADALTVNPFLGYDGIQPFIEDCEKYGKGLFILVKTSNKSSGQFQDLLTHQGKSVYEVIAELVNDWSKISVGSHGYSSVGAVVGATYPNQSKILRKIMKNSYLLVPGYGAQGGTARDVIHSFNPDGLGAIVNASRSIIYAYAKDGAQGKSFGDAARAEAILMRDDINRELDKKLG